MFFEVIIETKRMQTAFQQILQGPEKKTRAEYQGFRRKETITIYYDPTSYCIYSDRWIILFFFCNCIDHSGAHASPLFLRFFPSLCDPSCFRACFPFFPHLLTRASYGLSGWTLANKPNYWLAPNGTTTNRITTVFANKQPTGCCPSRTTAVGLQFRPSGDDVSRHHGSRQRNLWIIQITIMDSGGDPMRFFMLEERYGNR